MGNDFGRKKNQIGKNNQYVLFFEGGSMENVQYVP